MDFQWNGPYEIVRVLGKGFYSLKYSGNSMGIIECYILL